MGNAGGRLRRPRTAARIVCAPGGHRMALPADRDLLKITAWRARSRAVRPGAARVRSRADNQAVAAQVHLGRQRGADGRGRGAGVGDRPGPPATTGSRRQFQRPVDRSRGGAEGRRAVEEPVCGRRLRGTDVLAA